MHQIKARFMRAITWIWSLSIVAHKIALPTRGGAAR
jgi:hypothetical protein